MFLTGLRLNLGSGKDYREGYVNVEINRRFTADLYCDVMDLDYPDESVEMVVAKDVLDHVNHREALTLLKRIYGWLETSGVIVIHLPNLANIGRWASDGDGEALLWLYSSDGYKYNYDTNYSKWAYSPKSMRKHLENIGYTVLQVEVDCRGYGFTVVAKK